MIYIPKNHVKTSLNVIIWMHGWWVGDYRRHIFGPDETGNSNNLRESIDKSGKDVVLVAPWCGHKYSVPDPDRPGHSKAKGTLGLGNLAKDKRGVQPYLDEILGLLAPHTSG